MSTFIKEKPPHDLNNSKALAKDLLDNADENVASKTNNNETDSFGSLIAVVHDLKEKLNHVEQKFETFTADFEINQIGIKLDDHANQHSQTLQEKNDDLKSTNTHLIERLNEYEIMLENLNNKVKAAEDKKASASLVTAIRLLHSDRNTSLDTG